MTPRPSKFAVILNAKSRSGEGNIEAVQAALQGRAEFIRLTQTIEEQTAAIEDARQSHCDTIWIGGGDGSVRLAAEQILGSQMILAILPFGTGNSLARELGIPLDSAEAVNFHLEKSEIRAIDVGKFQCDIFVNVATIGLTSKIMEQVGKSQKGKFGRWVYLPALIRAIQGARSFALQVETPDGRFAGRAIQFVAASTRLHGGPFAVTEHASIDDGKLSMYVVRKGDRGALLRYGLSLIVGSHTELPNVWSVDSSTAQVTLSREGTFVIDGEPAIAKDVTLGIHKHGLLVSAAPSG